MDPLLEETAQRPRLTARERSKMTRERTPSRFERWAWSEIPAYRLGLTLGYAGTIYFGISAFIAGVPAFTIAAPEGWTPIWSAVLVVGGVVGLIGSIEDRRVLRAIELGASAFISATLTTYAGTVLFLAYASGDTGRVAAGAGFVGLAVPPVIRMLWLIAKMFTERKQRLAAAKAVAAELAAQAA